MSLESWTSATLCHVCEKRVFYTMSQPVLQEHIIVAFLCARLLVCRVENFQWRRSSSGKQKKQPENEFTIFKANCYGVGVNTSRLQIHRLLLLFLWSLIFFVVFMRTMSMTGHSIIFTLRIKTRLKQRKWENDIRLQFKCTRVLLIEKD